MPKKTQYKTVGKAACDHRIKDWWKTEKAKYAEACRGACGAEAWPRYKTARTVKMFWDNLTEGEFISILHRNNAEPIQLNDEQLLAMQELDAAQKKCDRLGITKLIKCQ